MRRRFTDFVYLYSTLSTEYPAVAVPPLPEKHSMAYVRGGRFSDDFTARRCRSLHRFLRRIALHPELRRSAILLLFLESAEWHATMRGARLGAGPVSPANSSPSGRLAPAVAAGDGNGNGAGGVFEAWTDTFLNAFAKVHKADKRFVEVRERADRLDDNIAAVEKAVGRVARRQADLAADYEEVAAQFARLETLEPGVAGPLTGFSRAVHASAEEWAELRNQTDRDYLSSLRDMEAYVGALRALLKAREQKQLDHEALSDYLARAGADRDQLASHHGGAGGVGGILRSKYEDVRGVDHEQSRRDRVRKLELEIERLTREVEGAKVASEMFDDRTVREVHEFERIKAVELKDTLGSLADAHINFFGNTIETWESFVREMEKERAS